MRKNNREFTEEVFLRSENRISKKNAFRKKVLLSMVCLALMFFIVPIPFMIGGASGGSSEMNGVVPNEQESNSSSMSSEQKSSGMTWDTETESEDAAARKGEVLSDEEDKDE